MWHREWHCQLGVPLSGLSSSGILVPAPHCWTSQQWRPAAQRFTWFLCVSRFDGPRPTLVTCRVAERVYEMLEYLKQVIQDQFDASLAMLDSCIGLCPAEHWEGQIGQAPFWQVAYHTLFFVDLYLSQDEASFRPPSAFREEAIDLGLANHRSGAAATAITPCEKELVADYVEHCRAKAAEVIAAETEQSLAKPSGFPWYPMSRGEHHLASIRHIQHHAGQLSAYLRKHSDKNAPWIGKL